MIKKKLKKIQFPKNFLFGVSTSAYQIEGDIKCDWSQWEKSPKRIKELKNKNLKPKDFICGKAANSYQKLDQDIECLKKLNCQAYRFSIEWARVEPKKGKIDQKAIKYYQELIKKLQKNNIEPFLTLWHWTNPIWITEQGGWENKKTIKYFLKYVNKISKIFPEIKFWITINEPMVWSSHSYFKGNWPPQKKNIFTYFKVLNNLTQAHIKAYQILKKQDSKRQIGLSKHNVYFEPYKNRLRNVFLQKIADWWWEKRLLNKIKNHQDFIGLNYYHHNRIKKNRFHQNANIKTNDLGWEIYPKGIYHELMDLKKYNLPIYITENGLADEKDEKRKDFIKNHLKYINKALKKNVKVKGYFYWSLLDNFEWAYGFDPKFGLFKIDKKNNFQRIPRKSAFYYANVCKNKSFWKI